MSWLILGVICVVFAAVALVTWRMWIAPWGKLEEILGQISRGKEPRTFLIDGAAEPRRAGLALENLFARQQELDQQITQRESGTQTILRALHDGLLVVDERRHIMLMNRTFEKLFELRDGAVVLCHDITQLKRLDQIRSDFVANVSHELRTPLSILRGYIETLLDNPKTSREELSRILEVMERHSKRLGLLVDDLLNLARLEASDTNLDISQVRVSELFNNVIRDWKGKLGKKNLKVVVDLPPDAPVIRADGTRLQEVLYNLLDNALKYSRENGEIRLQAAGRGSEIVLSVSDNGIGIGKDDLPRIFERFYRADKARGRELGGTGLGLSIVKHIAQLHGGRVEAESELGRGTTIRVLLPLD